MSDVASVALRRRARLQVGLAIAVCGLGLVTLFHEMLFVSWSAAVPVNIARGSDDRRAYPRNLFEETDHRFVVWLTFRNAYTLVGNPGGLFDAEPCHPADNVLALGEPGIGMGIIGIPFLWLSGDPIATYNGVLFVFAVVGFLSMYLLVKEWTGIPEAAIVAATLFAFHEIRIKDSIHFYAWDNAWTVLALYFTTRMFTRARFVDAVGLAIVIGLQLAGSFYPVLTAVFVALPVLVWFCLHFGIRQIRPLHLAFVVACILLVAVPIFAPYLAQTEAGVLSDRAYKVFLDLRWLMPGGPAFPGWMMLLLVASAFALPRFMGKDEEQRLDPRIAMVVISLLLMSLSVGGNTAARLAALQAGEPLPPEIPNLYDALASLVPGLGQVRGPAALYVGVHMALCILAGFGAACALRMAGRRRAVWAGLLITLAFVDVVRPGWLGLTPHIDYVTFEMKPPVAELEYFERIASEGGAGPLLELPFNPKNIEQASRAVLLAAYHRRRTAQCFNSFLPPEVATVRALSMRLPNAEALREIADLGFTTILVRGPADAGTNAALGPLVSAGRLRVLEQSGGLNSYAIVPLLPGTSP